MPASLSQCFGPLRVLLLVVLSCALVGCSSSDSLVPVHGLVVIDGEPVAGAIVTFYPVAGGVCSIDTTDISGRFTLRTQDGRLGATPGVHKVAVVHPDDLRQKPAGSTPELRTVAYRMSENIELTGEIVPLRYSSLSTSGVTVEVVPGKIEPVYLKLEY
jgi:hypothetical protein